MALPALSRLGRSRLRLCRFVTTSCPSSAFNRELLLYSDSLEDVVDPTVRRSQAKLARQAQIKMKEENKAKRVSLLEAESSNLSVAVPFIYGGAFQVRGGEGTVLPDEVIEHQHADEKALQEPQRQPVYPFGLFPKSIADPQIPRLGEGQQHVIEEEDEEPARSRGRGRRGRGARHRTSSQNNDYDADFDVLEDTPLKPSQVRKLLTDDEIFRYGTSDEKAPASAVPCGSCGAILHCNDPKLPGFVPTEIFKGKSEEQLRHVICQRCYVMREYNVALKMSVSPKDYPKTIQHLHTKRAIILLVVDLLDFPGSVWPNIVDLLGTNKRIILVGNKADLLPQDSPDYLKRIETSLKKNFLDKCNQGLITHQPDLVSTILVSARTGFGIEMLIDRIYDTWRESRRETGADIYLIGTTNVGKSSIFNALLESDLCKVEAVDKVEKAMTSPVPGTTLNLLKFPVMRPDPAKLNRRLQRLRRTMSHFAEKEEERLSLLRQHRDRKYAVLRGPVETTFVQMHRDKNLPFKGGFFQLQTRAPNVTLPERLDPNRKDFADGRWLYDTPGTVCEDQLIHLLTQEEVRLMVPDLPLRPRSYVMKLGQTLFIAGLARVDLISGPYKIHPLLVTVFAADGLPVNIVRTSDAEEFYREASEAGFLGVPIGDKQRLRDFPDLYGREFEIDGVDHRQSSCDLVLSSTGWVSFTPDVGRICAVRAWTPGGKGIYVRDPPFLPYASTLKGRRKPGTPTYNNDKVYVPWW